MVEEPGEHRPAGATAGQRMRVVMLVLTVFGFPLVLMLVFLGTRRLAFQPPFGDQPGGTLAGLLYDADGAKLAGVDVAAFVYPRAGEPRLHGTTTSDNGGAYAFEVPAIDGCYVVRAGGRPGPGAAARGVAREHPRAQRRLPAAPGLRDDVPPPPA
ncbi:MAG: hypothetical protein AAF682_31255 [Planctomycetota bacterium]